MEVARSRRVIGRNFNFVELIRWEVGRLRLCLEALGDYKV